MMSSFAFLSVRALVTVLFVGSGAACAGPAEGPAPQAKPRAPKPPIVYVARDGSGDFNCDGKDNQVEINKALERAATAPGRLA